MTVYHMMCIVVCLNLLTSRSTRLKNACIVKNGAVFTITFRLGVLVVLDFRIVSVTMFDYDTCPYYAVQTNDGGVLVYDSYAKLPDMVKQWMKSRNNDNHSCYGMVIFDKEPQFSCTVNKNG